jgi:DNA replication protein DnaC
MSSRATIPATLTRIADLASSLASVGLRAVAAILEDFIARVTKARLSPRQILEEIARLELADQAQRSLQSRLERARLGRFKPMADFDWNWPKQIERDLIERALTLDFLHESRNLVLIGTNGLGKTMIAKNIAFQAVQSGYSVIFTTAAELIERLQGDLSPTTFRRKLGRFATCQLLCVDEVGYLAYDAHAADLLYKVVDRRYEKHSILLTTNLAFRQWNTVFPNATSIATLLDKLTHHADVTLIEGDSYRKHESQKEAAARRKKRS